jgi:hypothetical protein
MNPQNPEIKRLLNPAIRCLVGIIFAVLGFLVIEDLFTSSILLCCGFFMIGFNIVPIVKFVYLSLKLRDSK